MTEYATKAALTRPEGSRLAKVAVLSRWAGRERLWLLTIALSALIAANLPILHAVVTTPPGTVFQGFVYNPPDGFSYLAWMRQGYEGSWLVTDRYTPEGTAPALVAPFYVLLGKLGLLLGGDLRLAFHLGRLLTGLLWLAAVAACCRRFLPRPSQRLLAFALVCFAGGFGWLARGLGIQSIDIYNNDATGFLTLFGPPHLPLSQALLLGAVLSFSASPRARRAWLLPAPGLLLAVEGLVHPYGVPLGLAVLAMAGALQTVRQPRQGIFLAAHWCATLLLALPALVYYQWLGRTDPVWSAVMSNNAANLTRIQPSALVFGYGPFLALAAVATLRLCQRRRWDELVLPLWVVFAITVAVSPIAYGARFLGAVYVPLVVLAVRGLALLGARWRARGGANARLSIGQRRLHGLRALTAFRPTANWGRSVVLALVLVAIVPNVLLIETRSVFGRGIWSLETGRAIGFRQPPVYLQRVQLDAIRWLALRPQDAVVLASPTIGNVLPALAGNLVVVGHLDLTVDFYRKFSDVRAFFSSEMDDGWRRQLLDRYRVDYVYYGANERRYGSFDPETAGGYLRAVFAGQGVTIYEVRLPGDVIPPAAPAKANPSSRGLPTR